jgi:hypothetical protein
VARIVAQIRRKWHKGAHRAARRLELCQRGADGVVRGEPRRLRVRLGRASRPSPWISWQSDSRLSGSNSIVDACGPLIYLPCPWVTNLKVIRQSPARQGVLQRPDSLELRDRAIVGFAANQQDRDQAPFSNASA